MLSVEKLLKRLARISTFFRGIDESDVRASLTLLLFAKILGHGWEKLGAKIYNGHPSDSPTWAIGNYFYLFLVSSFAYSYYFSFSQVIVILMIPGYGRMLSPDKRLLDLGVHNST